MSKRKDVVKIERELKPSDLLIDAELFLWVQKRERFLRWWMEAEKKMLYGTLEAHYIAGELTAFAIRGTEKIGAKDLGGGGEVTRAEGPST